MNEWLILDTGGHVYVSVKDMILKGNKGKRAVGVTADAVCVYGKPYDDEWSFFEDEDRSWPVETPEQIADFIESSKDIFTKEQQEDILRQRDTYWEGF
ncbi:hypothetical protein [Neomoorella thermoacetica]|nr:hypothetical protein [Moorella thermoacetica]